MVIDFIVGIGLIVGVGFVIGIVFVIGKKGVGEIVIYGLGKGMSGIGDNIGVRVYWTTSTETLEILAIIGVITI